MMLIRVVPSVLGRFLLDFLSLKQKEKVSFIPHCRG